MKQYDKIYIQDGLIGQIGAKHAVISGTPMVLTEKKDVFVLSIEDMMGLFHAGVEYDFFDRSIEPRAEEKALHTYLASKGVTV